MIDDDGIEEFNFKSVSEHSSQAVEKVSSRLKGGLEGLDQYLDEFMKGQLPFPTFCVGFHRRYSDSLGYPDLIESASHLATQAEEIWSEKGYRDNILTGKEHRDIGSSGYAGFEKVNPNVPIVILNQQHQLSDSMDEMTIEEVRRARELDGISTIDERGEITGKVTPITDSYHFLTAERRDQVIELEERLVSEMTGIVETAIQKHEEGLRTYSTLVQQIAEGKKSSAEAYTHVDSLMIGNHRKSLRAVVDEAKKLSFQEGYRNEILTPMELSILGLEVDQRYLDNPYSPIGVQNGTLSIAAANELRANEQHFEIETDILTTEYTYPWAFTLELLNETGYTERGPIVLSISNDYKPLDEKTVGLFKDKVKGVQFSRPCDWYHTEG